MHIKWIDAKELISEEIYQLEMLKTAINRTTTDSIITQDEITVIKAPIRQMKKQYLEAVYPRMELYHLLVTERVH